MGFFEQPYDMEELLATIQGALGDPAGASWEGWDEPVRCYVLSAS